jgi:phenylacetate-coenzyme A ligase PaaK-like adenylate-forming protein
MKRLLSMNDYLSMTKQQCDEYQDNKFSAYVRHRLIPNNPYYRNLFRERGVDPESITSIGDWQTKGLPLITKAVYRENLLNMTVNPWTVDGRQRSLKEVWGNFLEFEKNVGNLERGFVTQRLPRRDIRTDFDSEPLEALEELGGRLGADAEAERRAWDILNYNYSPVSVFFTGGSTGLPTPINQTRLDRDLYSQSTIVMMNIAGCSWLREKAGRVVSMTIYPFAPHQGWWVTSWGAENVSDFFISTSGGGVLPTENLVMLLVRFRINFLTGMPGFVRNKFLKKALEMKKVMQGIQFPEYMALNLGGEKIMPKARNEMREMLHELGVKEARITGAWGCSETRFNLLGECDCFQETGYHSTGWDKVAYRIVKMKSPDDWEFAAPGEEGFVVQFPMDGAGTIIEGFILGDMAVQLDGPCPVCGSYVERFVNPLRANELDTQLMIMGLVEQKVKGASVNLTDLRGQLLEIPEVDELQIVVTKKDPADPGSEDLLVLNVALKKMPGIDESAVKAALASRAKALSEITPEVVLMGMDELMGEGLKFKVIVDRRP